MIKNVFKLLDHIQNVAWSNIYCFFVFVFSIIASEFRFGLDLSTMLIMLKTFYLFRLYFVLYKFNLHPVSEGKSAFPMPFNIFEKIIKGLKLLWQVIVYSVPQAKSFQNHWKLELFNYLTQKISGSAVVSTDPEISR